MFLTWRAWLFPFLIGAIMIPALLIPLSQLVPRIGHATFGFRDWVALGAVVFFEIIAILMVWGGIVSIRRAEINMQARVVTATLREIWKTHVSHIPFDQLVAVRTGRIKRGRPEKSKVTDCYWLELVTRSGARLRLLETTEAKTVAEIGELICRHAAIPAAAAPDEASRW